jgi:squalene synthase HpnC
MMHSTIPEKPLLLAQDHYENFPVAPFFLAGKKRKVVALIYAFARIADDIADEGDKTPEIRLRELNDLALLLQKSISGIPVEYAFINELATAIHEYKLPLGCFWRLLEAFKQDALFEGYADFPDLMAYCHLSANPIGQLLLSLFQKEQSDALIHSNALCTALQLLNFIQDLKEDLARGRCTLPQDELLDFQIPVGSLIDLEPSPELNNLVSFQLNRIEAIIDQASPLPSKLSGTFGLQSRFTVAGAYRLLKKLRERKSPFEPCKMSRWDYARLIF